MNIDKLNFRSTDVIPATYTDELSKMEMIAMLISKVNFLIDLLNKYQRPF